MDKSNIVVYRPYQAILGVHYLHQLEIHFFNTINTSNRYCPCGHFWRAKTCQYDDINGIFWHIYPMNGHWTSLKFRTNSDSTKKWPVILETPCGHFVEFLVSKFLKSLLNSGLKSGNILFEIMFKILHWKYMSFSSKVRHHCMHTASVVGKTET